MQTRIIIAPENPIRFVPEDYERAPQFNTTPFDKAWFSEQLQDWQQPVTYARKMQKNDPLDLQFLINSTGTATISVVSCDSPATIFQVVMDQPTGMPEIVINGIQYYVHRVRRPNFFSGRPDGTYALYLDVEFDPVAGVNETFISEPISVKDMHPGTVLIDVGNSFNTGVVIYEQTRQRFRHRVSAALTRLQAKVNRTVFVDQGQNTVPLSATAYRGWEFIIGGDGQPVPDYEVDKFNHLFTLDSIYIDGKQLTPAEGASFEDDGEDVNNPLRCVKIQLEEVDNEAVFEFVKGPVSIIEIPAYPFMITGVYVGLPNNPAYSDDTVTRIGNNTQLDEWVAARNLELTAEGFTGEFQLETGASTILVYANGEYETFTYGQLDVMLYRLGLKFTTTGAVPDLSASIVLGLAAHAAIDGATSAKYVIANPSLSALTAGIAYTDTSDAILPAYSAGAAGTYTYELWHDSTSLGVVGVESVHFNGFDKYSIAANLPQRLRLVSISGSQRLTSFNIWSELGDLRPTLRTLIMVGNTVLATIPDGLYVAGVYAGWQRLRVITLASNALSTSTLNALYNSTFTAMTEQNWLVNNGAISTGGQSGGGAPNATSASARYYLSAPYPTGHGWLVSI